MVLKDQEESGPLQNTCSDFTKSQKPHGYIRVGKNYHGAKNIHLNQSIAVERFFWKGVSCFEAFIGVIAFLCAILIFVLSFLFTFYIGVAVVG